MHGIDGQHEDERSEDIQHCEASNRSLQTSELTTVPWGSKEVAALRFLHAYCDVDTCDALLVEYGSSKAYTQRRT